MRFIFVLAFTCLFSQMAVAAGAPADTVKKHPKTELSFPDPVNVSKLFYIQRSKNINTLIYDLNLDKTGEPDSRSPLKIYWIRYNNKGEHEDLDYIQRKFAYGVDTKVLKRDEWDVRFVAYKKLPLILRKSSDGKYHIFTLIAKKEAILNRIFVRTEGGTFWIPNVVYAELKGTDPVTGKEVLERFKP